MLRPSSVTFTAHLHLLWDLQSADSLTDVWVTHDVPAVQTFNSSVTYQHLVADNPDVRPPCSLIISAVDLLCIE